MTNCNRYLDCLLHKYSRVIVYERREPELFLLIDVRHDHGRVLLNKIGTKFKRDLESSYAYCFKKSTYYMGALRDRDVKYVCLVFSVSNLVFMMSVRSQRPLLFTFDDVCKAPNYGKGIFINALRFVFSNAKTFCKTMTPTKSVFLLALDTHNPYICTAFSAYIKAGFVPHHIEKINSTDHIVMKYDKNSMHIRTNPLSF